MGGNNISYKKFTTHLVLIVDNKLTWELQIKAVTSCSTHKIDQQETDG